MAGPAITPKSREWIARAVFEAALIVFAVVLGFMITAWREGAQARAESRAAMDRIEAELHANLEALQAVLPYHQRLAADLAGLEAGGTDTPLIERFMTIADRGVGDLYLSDAAWTTALATDALARADFADVQRLAVVYDAPESGVLATWRAIVGQLGAQEAFEPDPDGTRLARFTVFYQELVAQERFLVQRYEEALEAADG